VFVLQSVTGGSPVGIEEAGDGGGSVVQVSCALYFPDSNVHTRVPCLLLGTHRAEFVRYLVERIAGIDSERRAGSVGDLKRPVFTHSLRGIPTELFSTRCQCHGYGRLNCAQIGQGSSGWVTVSSKLWVPKIPPPYSGTMRRTGEHRGVLQGFNVTEECHPRNFRDRHRAAKTSTKAFEEWNLRAEI
jgi:hypothetical protein